MADRRPKPPSRSPRVSAPSRVPVDDCIGSLCRPWSPSRKLFERVSLARFGGVSRFLELLEYSALILLLCKQLFLLLRLFFFFFFEAVVRKSFFARIWCEDWVLRELRSRSCSAVGGGSELFVEEWSAGWLSWLEAFCFVVVFNSEFWPGRS